MEHCARAMDNTEYASNIKGYFQEIELEDDIVDISCAIENNNNFGWCRNFKGFIPYRHIIENQ